MRTLASTLFMSSFLLLACQEGHVSHSTGNSLHHLLEKGVRQNRGNFSRSNALALSASDSLIVAEFNNESNNSMRLLQFNTDKMSPLSRSEILPFLVTFLQSRQLLSIETLESALNKQEETFHRLSSNLLGVDYSQKIDGIPVKGGFFQAIFVEAEDYYYLREIRSHLIDPGLVKRRGHISDVVTVDELIDLTGWDGVKIVSESQEFWAKYTAEGIYLDAVTNFELSHEQARYTISIDHQDRQLIGAFKHNLHQSKQIVTTIAQGEGKHRKSVTVGLPLTRVNEFGKSYRTNLDGQISANLSPNEIQLKSNRVNIFRDKSDQVIKLPLKQATNNAVYEVDGDNAAVHSFALIQKINRFARQYFSTEELPFLDQTINAHVGVEGECNAFYTTGIRKITFYRESKACNDSALIDDVVFHEWGHALDDHTGRKPGVTDSAFSEGIADVVAAYYSQDPVIGRDFYKYHNEGIRDLRNKMVYPRDIGSAHHEGGIIASAFWELRERLIDRYGERRGHDHAAFLFFRHLLLADSYLDSYFLVLALDDKDGNPANRSANFCLINNIFAQHGLAEDLNCVDEITEVYQSTEFDADLNVALLDDEDGKVSIFVSSQYAEGIELCLGDRTECLSNNKNRITFALHEKAGRSLFKSPYPVELTYPGLVTFLAKNNEGLIIGSRVMKLFRK